MVPEHVQIVPPRPDAIAELGIAGIAVVMAVLAIWYFAAGHPRRRVWLGIAVAAVMALSATAARTGLLSRFDVLPPPMLVMIVVVFGSAFAFALSPWGGEAAAKLSFACLVGLQIFRLPLELVMHHAGDVGIMPVELSYSGFNFDIVTGAGALFLYLWLQFGKGVPPFVLWVWNAWGSLCLLVIAFIAITSSPIVRLYGDDPAHVNTWVLFFPYVWLPVVLVTIAVASHVMIWRKLLSIENRPLQTDLSRN